MKVILRVKIGELMLRNSELELVEVTQELGRHSTCRIEFIRDRGLDANLDDLLRDDVAVVIQGEGGAPTEIFRGAIADGVQTHLLNFGSRFILDAISPSERHDFADTVYYPKATLASIAQKAGVKIVGSLRRSPGPFDYVQWGETEFDFLRRVTDEHGGFLVTTGEQVEIRSEFVDKGWELLWGDTLLEVSARARPVNHGVTGASYDPKEKGTHGHAGIRQNPASTGGAARLVSAMAELAKSSVGGGDPILDEPAGRASNHADFKAVLRAESERALGGAATVECASTLCSLMVGDLVNLIEGLNFKLPTTGKLGVVKVVHTFKEQLYGNRFVATPWKNFTSFERPDRPLMKGPVTAEVIENIDPDNMGRLRVAYRWQFGDATNWARLASPYAGNARGFMCLPENGDEVIVAFEAGDPERPLIIGSLWNGKDKPPQPVEKNDAKRWITRAGNTIQLLDHDNEETIEVFTADGKCMIQLTNKGSAPVITIKSAGDISLEAEQELRIKCQKFTQEVASDSARKIGGSETVAVGGNAMITAGMDIGLSGGMNAILKGLNVESVAAALNNVVGAMVHLQPPGFVGKQVSAKSVSVKDTDLGERPTPEAAAPARSADPETPRS